MNIRLAAVAALLAAAPAQAVTFTSTPGSTASFATPSGTTTVDFNGALPAGFTLAGGNYQLVSGDTVGQYAEPAFSDGSRYLAVLANGVATLASSTGFGSVSFFLGSIDSYNSVQILSLGGAVLGTFTGSQLSALANGNQDLPSTNSRVTFTNTPGEAAIGGVRFLSSGASLEVDNVSFGSAVPDIATWGMMLVGFAAMGLALRSPSRTTRVRFSV